MMKKTPTWKEILVVAQKVIKKCPISATKTSIPQQTIRSQKILKEWKEKCLAIDPQLVTMTPDPIARRFQFALHDKQNGIVYELKLNTANPKAFLDKLVRKLITYNTLHEASEDCRELTEIIAGKDYHKISEVHVFTHAKVIEVYQETLIRHYLWMVQKYFNVHIDFHPLA